jgi:hypothetical protein
MQAFAASAETQKANAGNAPATAGATKEEPAGTSEKAKAGATETFMESSKDLSNAAERPTLWIVLVGLVAWLTVELTCVVR